MSELTSQKFVTQLPLENNGSKFPCVIIKWFEDPDGCGYVGKAAWWKDGDNLEPRRHEITIRQTMPIGLIHIEFNSCYGGAWKFSMINGTDITCRDLQWATVWAASVKEMWDERHKQITERKHDGDNQED